MTKTKFIDKAETERQRGFIYSIKELSAQFCAEHGRQPLALTETYGCQQNENDTERIRGMLAESGFGFTDSAENADIVIYNTCAVRENAEDRVFGRLGILKHIKRSRPNMLIALCGCMVQQEHIADTIKKKYPHVDMVFGTHALYKLPELLYTNITTKKRVFSIESSDGAVAEDMPILRADNAKAWVSIMYGCNNFCSYCIVPYVRGRERSRKSEDIINEIRTLVENGCTEITLLGQNVNSYGKDLDEGVDFSDLLRMVNDIEGIHRIRFMTSHPKDFGDKLIKTMKECTKVCRQLHLPFQAGSNKVLRDMNRRYTREEYLEKIARLKAEIPDIALSTDVIVGYPTETCEDFEDTIDVLRRVEFDSLYSFIYSRRSGTPAAKLDFELSTEKIHENFNRLLEVQNEISKRKNDAYVGRVVEVLADGVSKNNADMQSGRTESGKIVNFAAGADLKDKYVKVRITQSHTWSLNGELVDE